MLETLPPSMQLNWSPRSGGRVALDAARGLAFLHWLGIAHRDVKSAVSLGVWLHGAWKCGCLQLESAAFSCSRW